MTKGNDFATEIDPIVNGNGYRKMASPENGKNNSSSRDTLSNQPRGEASDVAPREIRRWAANAAPPLLIPPYRSNRAAANGIAK